MPPNQLILLVKAPRPGLVKTRLAADLGPAEAASAYRTLVENLLHRLRDLPELELHFAPDDALQDIRQWLRNGWTAKPQCAGDLGHRLQTAFSDAFASGTQKVVIIGSDCPSVEPEDICAAWEGLSTQDVVLGPANDGGYWLIGLRQPREELFVNMPWSTPAVLQETLQRCLANGLQVLLLRELSDVDTKEDWQAFLQSLVSRHV